MQLHAAPLLSSQLNSIYLLLSSPALPSMEWHSLMLAVLHVGARGAGKSPWENLKRLSMLNISVKPILGLLKVYQLYQSYQHSACQTWGRRAFSASGFEAERR